MTAGYDHSEHWQEGEAPAPDPKGVGEEAPPSAATITITFAEGTLNLGIKTEGEINKSHLWAAAEMMHKVADQLFEAEQAQAQAKIIADKRAIQAVAAQMRGGLVVPGRKS